MPIIWKVDIEQTLEAKGWPLSGLAQERIIGMETASRLRRGEMVGMRTLARICALLRCQPKDILEYVQEAPEKPPVQTRRGRKSTLDNKERVEAWQAAHPDGLQIKCAADLGIGQGTVSRYWNKEQEEKTTKERVQEWQTSHPGGLQRECAADLEVTQATVSHYWRKEKPEKPTKERVEEWQMAHPGGLQRECAADLGITQGTVSHYWRKGKSTKERVEEWQAAHPGGLQRECAADLEVTQAAIGRYWHKQRGRE